MIAALRKLLRREKPRVFLGTLAVVPRTDFKRHIDQLAVIQSEDIDASLQNALQEIFTLPPASDVSDPLPTDLALDVFIQSFQSGDYWELSLGEIGFPVFWRPKVTVACRLYGLKSKKTKRTYCVTQKMPWREFWGRQVTWRAMFRFRPTFGAEDLNRLLYLACYSLLNKLRKAA